MNKTLHTEQQQIFLAALREAREHAGLTQSDVAIYLGVPQSDISKCERGVRRLDVVELHSWICALGGSFTAFAEELDQRLEAAAERRRHATAGRRLKSKAGR